MQNAKVLMLIGVLLFVLGGLVFLAARIGLTLGDLPGDLRIQRENFSCMFPLTSMIVISVVLTIILNLVLRLWKK